MSTETTNKKIKIDNGTTFGRTYTDKAIDAKLPTDLIASANKISLGAGNTALGNGVNLDGFTYDESTKTLKASGGESIPVVEGTVTGQSGSFLNRTVSITIPNTQTGNFILHIIEEGSNLFFFINNNLDDYNATIDEPYDTNTLIHSITIISGRGTSIKIQVITLTNNYFINGSIDSTNKITISDIPLSPFFCQILNEEGELYKVYQMYTNPSTDISYGYGEFDVGSNSFTYITNKGQATKNEFKEYKIVIPKVV